MARTLCHVDLGSVEYRVIRSESIADGIAQTGRDHDLVAIGAAKTGMFQQLLFGEIPDRVGQFAPGSVMLVKRHEGLARGFIKRLMT